MNVVRYSADAIRKLIEQDKLYKFYRSRAWRNLSHAVIAENNNECFFCKRSGKYSPAIETHHIMRVRDYPELAYSRFYHGTDGRDHINLVPVCHDCHMQQHGKKFGGQKKFFTAERW